MRHNGCSIGQANEAHSIDRVTLSDHIIHYFSNEKKGKITFGLFLSENIETCLCNQFNPKCKHGKYFGFLDSKRNRQVFVWIFLTVLS